MGLSMHALDCPHCKDGKLRCVGNECMLLCCSSCESVFQQSSTSSSLKRLNVEPVSDLSPYPEVTLISETPYCDCVLKEYLETFSLHIGPAYCPKHNVIIVHLLLEPEQIERIEEVTIEIINHETLHWILCRDVGNNVSHDLDKVPSISPLI